MGTDREKMERILTLLTDQTVGKLLKTKQLQSKDEEFGGLVTIGHCFKEACKIAKEG